jgi:hydroxyacyl-ACP dehydratase HTD2-like protein with hotdog domain
MTVILSPGEPLPDVVMVPTALQLFRYSAVTWNAHRIHYDREWAAHEGHEGLVVHSHLHAANALRVLTQGLGSEWRICKVAYRIIRSAVVGDTLTAQAELIERSDDGRTLTFALREVNQDGAACLEGSAIVEARH